MRVRWLTFVALLTVGCPKRTDPVTAPADSVASKSTPSATAAPLVLEGTQARCINGTIVEPIAAKAVDADAESSSGGWGDGIGLGTVGGFAGWGPFHGFTLKGQALRIDGLEKEKAEKVICDGYHDVGVCFHDQTSPKEAFEGTVGVTLAVDGDGKVRETKFDSGKAKDVELEKCVSKAIGKLTFGTPTGSEKKAAVSYVFEARVVRARKATTNGVKMIEKGTVITGKLPPEVIKRIVRANFPRFRVCYEQGLKKEPKLAGTVANKFVIDATGAVESVTAEGGTLPNEQVKSCITGVFRTLSFPEPEGGKVTVTYPLEFQRED